MKTSYIVIAVVIAVAALGGMVMLQSNNNVQTPTLEEEGRVAYNSEGYSPQELKIKKGEIVTFKNESSAGMWPASAFHPTHTAYPGSGILKCDTPEEGTIFDACRAVEPGIEWQFQFNDIGSWKYHDHLVPTRTGTVIVE